MTGFYMIGNIGRKRVKDLFRFQIKPLKKSKIYLHSKGIGLIELLLKI